MKSWKVVTPGHPLELIEEATPVPTGSEVLVEVTHCGVCHSDLHFWKGAYNMGGGKMLQLSERGVILPRAPGHEVAGRVVGKGPDAIGVAIGDLRVVYPWLGCGECVYCRSERDNMCSSPSAIGVVRDGGFGSHVVVPHARYLADPGAVNLALAATYACSGITVYSAVDKIMPLDPEAPVLLIGAGGLGLMGIAMLVALGHRNIVSVDVDEEKRGAAMTAGARLTLDGNSPHLVQDILDSCGPTAAVLDFVGTDTTARAGFDSLAKGGSFIGVGVSGGELTVSLPGMIFGAKSVRGSLTGNPKDLRAVLALANSGKLKPTPVSLCQHDHANDALRNLLDGKVTGRTVLVRA
jgi:alcohol dehydrogenase, propanol-preferring